MARHTDRTAGTTVLRDPLVSRPLARDGLGAMVQSSAPRR